MPHGHASCPATAPFTDVREVLPARCQPRCRAPLLLPNPAPSPHAAGGGRFLKTLLCVHDEGGLVVVKVWGPGGRGRPGRGAFHITLAVGGGRGTHTLTGCHGKREMVCCGRAPPSVVPATRTACLACTAVVPQAARDGLPGATEAAARGHEASAPPATPFPRTPHPCPFRRCPCLPMPMPMAAGGDVRPARLLHAGCNWLAVGSPG